MSPIERSERRIREVFFVSVILKGLNAIGEVVLGVLLLFSSHYASLLSNLIVGELVEDPGDFLARHANDISAYLTPQFQLYGGLYLLSHGVVKGFIVWGLLREKLWAYPAGMAVFSLFIVYQVVKWTQAHSWILVWLTVFDLLVLWLIWHEYRYIQTKSL